MQSVDSLRLERTPAGRLALTLADGSRHEGVTPVRAFPIAAPQEGLSLVGSDGHELLWIAQLSALPTEARQLIEQELAAREFIPVIEHIESVTSFSTPCTWTLRTDRGDFVLDNLTDAVRPWDQTGYRFLKRQASNHTGRWVTIRDGQPPAPLVGSVSK